MLSRPALPRPDARIALLTSVAIALLIAIGEVDHLLAQVMTDGRTSSVTELSGIGAVFSPGDTASAWSFFAHPAPEIPDAVRLRIDDWLRLYALLDLALVVTYLRLGVRWFRRTPGPAWRATALYVGAGADAIENVLILFGARPGWGLWAASSVKWLALAVVTVVVVRSLLPSLSRLPKALYTHRYSALIVLPLGALSLGRGPDLLEQIPDIQRAWADPEGHGDFVAAAAVMGLLVVSTLVIGRQRTDHLWLRTCERWTGDHHLCATDLTDPDVCPVLLRRQTEEPPLPLLRLWLIGPVLLGVSALALHLAGAEVAGWRLLAFVSVPVAVFGLSLWLRGRAEQPARPQRPPISVARFRAAALVGDVLVGMLMLIAGLGSIRAFTGPLALDGPTTWTALLLTAGVGAVVGTWPLFDRILAAIAAWGDRRPGSLVPDTLSERVMITLTPGMSPVRRDPPADDPGAEPAQRLRLFLDGFAAQRAPWAVLAISGTAMFAVALAPVPLADRFGVIATFQLALGALSVLIAATVILLQPGGAPEVFWPARIPFAPVTSLIVAGCLFAGIVGADDVHRIRTYDGPRANFDVATRPPVSDVFDAWLRSGDACATPLRVDPSIATPLRVRPLMLYAAEGGGIRAAYWTTATIDLIANDPPGTGADLPDVCRSAMLSSGASGGSVGLAIASVREPGTAAAAVEDIAGSEALGAASDGLVLRDTIYAATGVPVPSLGDDRPGRSGWADRATLIEQAWEESIEGFDRPFLRPRATRRWGWGPTGALVINSTSPTTSCRTLLSQVRLPGTSTNECSPGRPAPGSTDLVACTGQLRTVTAALLTARFPYVTPSGVTSCPGPDGFVGGEDDVTTQIVDGGYAENTGVGTLIDLMPQVLADVRRHNGCVLRAAAAAAILAPGFPEGDPCVGEGSLDTIVVPQLVYFDNGTGSDLLEQPRGLTLEALVPPVTILKAKGALFSPRSQLERATDMLASAQLVEGATPGVSAVVAAIEEWRRRPVAVVFQATRPGVAAPLGWVLSDASIRTLDQALCNQDQVADIQFTAPPPPVEVTEAAPEATPEPERGQFGTIDDVLALLPGTAPACQP